MNQIRNKILTCLFMIIQCTIPLVIAWNLDEHTEGSICTIVAVVVGLVVVAGVDV